MILKLVNGDFLDVGCGLGDFLSFGSEKSLGLDINKFNTNFCKKRGLSAELIKNGIFPIDDNSFSTIILDQVLEHLEDPNLLMEEITRTLNIRGKLLIGVPCKKGFRRDEDHKIFYDLKKIKEVLKKYNFTVLKAFYYPLPLKIFGKFLSQQSLYVMCQLEKKL